MPHVSISIAQSCLFCTAGLIYSILIVTKMINVEPVKKKNNKKSREPLKPSINLITRLDADVLFSNRHGP